MESAAFDSRSERQLRFITVASMAPALALLIPHRVLMYQRLPAIGLAPMAMSAVVGAATFLFKIPNKQKAMTYIIVFFSLLAVLIPSWDRSIHSDKYNYAPDLQLAAYGATPLTINLIIHAHLACMHLSSLLPVHDCPNCKNHTCGLPRWQRPITLDGDIPADDGHIRGLSEPLIRAYADDGARESSDFQTSGCNTPRQSSETLASSARTSKDIATGEGPSGGKSPTSFD